MNINDVKEFLPVELYEVDYQNSWGVKGPGVGQFGFTKEEAYAVAGSLNAAFAMGWCSAKEHTMKNSRPGQIQVLC